MMTPQHPMHTLFDQLGLDSSAEAIDQFIAEHQLKDSTKLHEADFWTPSQSRFLQESLTRDADWADVIDELNERLHS